MSGNLDVCSDCQKELVGALDDATLNLWEESLSPDMTSEDSIRSEGWQTQSETLPSPRARSLGSPGAEAGDSVDFEIQNMAGVLLIGLCTIWFGRPCRPQRNRTLSIPLRIRFLRRIC